MPPKTCMPSKTTTGLAQLFAVSRYSPDLFPTIHGYARSLLLLVTYLCQI